MTTQRLAFAVTAALVSAATFGAGCSSTDDTPSPFGTKDGGASSDGGTAKAIDLEVACADANATLDGNPGTLPDEKGAIIKCAPFKTYTRDELDAAARTSPSGNIPESYTGKHFTSGAKVYRVLYRTERGSSPASPAASVALVYLPDTPVADKVPAVIFAHGSRGQAPQCAPSVFSPDGEQVRGDFDTAVLPIVGLGLPVIAPDNAGYSNYGAANNPPPGYASVDDVGKSALDAGRALAKLIASRLSGKVTLVGHSQGGHSALSALALSSTYGTAGTVTAVATHAPLWFSQRSWGALFNLEDSYKVNESVAVPVSIWYHYTHGELLDGPGHGLDPFKPEIRAQIKDFVDTVCWSGTYPKLTAIGNVASAFFDPTFVQAVSAPAGFGDKCSTDPTLGPICTKWIARYLADRPVFQGEAAKVPILVTRGGLDTTIPADSFACAVDFFNRSGSPLSFCYDPAVNHGGIVRAHGDYAIDWLLNKTMGTAITASCPAYRVNAVDEAGAPVACLPIPPND